MEELPDMKNKQLGICDECEHSRHLHEWKCGKGYDLKSLGNVISCKDFSERHTKAAL